MFRFLLIISFAPALFAEVRLSPESAPGYALKHNPSLAAARLRIDEARARLKQSGRFANPEIEIELSRNLNAPEGAVGVGFSQQFPLTARLRLEKAVSRAMLAAAEAEVRDAERKLRAEAGMAMVKLLALGGQRALRERQLTNSRELSEFTRQRMAVGEASAVDAGSVELETQMLRSDLLQLAAERATLLGELRALAGVRPGDAITIGGELAAPAGLPGPAVDPARRPDFIAARHSAEAAKQGAMLARAQRWEDIRIGLSISRERAEDAPDGFERDTFAGLKFSLPLPLWDTKAGRIEEADAAAKRAAFETDALAFQIRAETATARDTMAALAKVVNELGGTLPKAEQIEKQLRESYASGLTPLTEVLRARDRRLALERQRLDALRDYHLARVRHAATTGQSNSSTKSFK